MKNSYAGVCLKCLQRVEVGEGHFVRRNKRWRLIHDACAVHEDSECVPPRWRKGDKTKEKPD